MKEAKESGGILPLGHIYMLCLTHLVWLDLPPFCERECWFLSDVNNLIYRQTDNDHKHFEKDNSCRFYMKSVSLSGTV